jgi:hypothetical protein
MNNSKSPFGGILKSQANVQNAEVKYDELALKCENMTSKAVRPPYRCITCKKLAREHKNNDVKHGKAKEPTDSNIYLQVLNDQNRKTEKWLSDQINIEKNANQLKSTLEANAVVSEERIRQIDHLRNIHDQDTDHIQRLNGQVSATNRQYQNMLQKQTNDQTQIKELRKHISARDNLIEDVIRIQNSANATKIPSTNPSATPPEIDLTTPDLPTGVK